MLKSIDLTDVGFLMKRMSIDSIFVRSKESAHVGELLVGLISCLRGYYGQNRVGLTLELDIDSSQFTSKLVVDGETRLTGNSTTATGTLEEVLMGLIVLGIGIEKELPPGKLDKILTIVSESLKTPATDKEDREKMN